MTTPIRTKGRDFAPVRKVNGPNKTYAYIGELPVRAVSTDPNHVAILKAMEANAYRMQPSRLQGVEVVLVEPIRGGLAQIRWNELSKLANKSFTNRYSRRLKEKQAAVGKVLEAGSQARLKAQQDAAITAAFGLLKGKDVLPLDALRFEQEMRDE